MHLRGKILRDTADIIEGARNRDYGDPFDDFGTTANFWETYITRVVVRRGEMKLEPHDVAAMMMLLKIARLTWTPGVKDHWMDAIGYAALGWECSVTSGIVHEQEHKNQAEKSRARRKQGT